jgi:Patatin-like phospholipase
MADQATGKAPRQAEPISTEDVLREEAKAIHGVTLSETGPALYDALFKEPRAALCLSGGGIRSAAFALGVIQALATHPRTPKGDPVGRAEDSLLAKFHYLSTVSGGGYIGSWLSAWISRSSFKDVWAGLVRRQGGIGPEAPQIGWIRSYSNFLTPRLGVASADAWAGVVLYFRNLILNWFVLLPALCVLLILLKLAAIAVVWISLYPHEMCGRSLIDVTPLALGAVCLISALRFTTRNRPTRGNSPATPGDFVRWDLLPALLSAFLLSVALAWTCTHDMPIWAGKQLSPVWLGVAAGAATYAVSWLIAWPKAHSSKDRIIDVVSWVAAGAAFGGIVGIGITLYLPFDSGDSSASFLQPAEILLLAFGLPWIFGAQLAADMIFAGLSSYEENSDADQEWLGRAAGYFLVTALLWCVIVVFVFARWNLIPEFVGDHYEKWLAGIGGVSGIVTWIIGQSGLSPATGEAKNKVQISAKVILGVAAPIFAVSILIGTTVLLDHIIFGKLLTTTEFFGLIADAFVFPLFPDETRLLLIALAIVGVIGVVASLFVNINRFSLHALYRNRLIRAFLGASNDARHANPFTDLDPTDNLPMKCLWKAQTAPAGASWRPFHVINMTLNTVATKKLAWQERKAQPFTVSPLHSGSALKGFRSSAEYGHAGRGISLGTAMAISGAAISPNRGYQSSAAGSFVLSLFNVRLGWWLGNPGEEGNKTYTREGPTIAILPHIYEAFGLTTDDRRYIYLSDGGHFENLGLYEMIRRRCRFIVVSDAGCDPNYEFEDLGNAVRKIGIDLGVAIVFHGMDRFKSRKAEKDKQSDEKDENVSFHAIGVIRYPLARGGTEEGVILYVKPGYHDKKIANIGVRNYAQANPAFPHEGTSDQWFSESQFESYRALGFEIVDELLKDPDALEELFGRPIVRGEGA